MVLSFSMRTVVCPRLLLAPELPAADPPLEDPVEKSYLMKKEKDMHSCGSAWRSQHCMCMLVCAIGRHTKDAIFGGTNRAAIASIPFGIARYIGLHSPT